ncbi:hypothetical protein KIPB_007224, partial [Kipferlia bialata]|eukprot:g7224.t1
MLSVVTYESSAKSLTPMLSMTPVNKATTCDALNAMRATGCTAMCAGLCQAVINLKKARDEATHDVSQRVTAVFLLTDGQANEGVTDPEGMLAAAIGSWSSGVIPPEATDEGLHRMGRGAPMPFGIHNMPNQAPWEQMQMQQQMPVQQMPQAARPGFLRRMMGRGGPRQAPEPPIQMQTNTIDINDINDMNEVQMQQAPQVQVVEPPQIQTQQAPQIQQVPTPVPAPTETQAVPASVKPPADFPPIYTYGYGASHSVALLSNLAERSNGQYTFIDNNDTIGEAFSDILGGIASTVANKVTMVIEPLNGASVGNVRGTYPSHMEGASAVVELRDLRANEARDIVFQMNLPAADVTDLVTDYVHVTLRYTDMACPDEVCETHARAGVTRPVSVAADAPVNPKVEAHSLRLDLADGITEARQLAQRGDMAQARAKLVPIRERVAQAQTAQDAEVQPLIDGFLVNLSEAEEAMTSESHFRG